MDTDSNDREKPTAPVNFKKMKALVKKLRIRSGDLLLVKQNSALSKMPTIQMLKDAIEAAGYKDVLLIVADDIDDIKVAEDSEMFKHGWMRMQKFSQLTGAIKYKPPVPESVSDDNT